MPRLRVAFFLLCLSFDTQAIESLFLTLASLEYGGIRADNISIRMDGIDTGSGGLDITAGQIESMVPGLITGLRLQCHHAEYRGDRVNCLRGTLTGLHATMGRFEGDFRFTYTRQQGLASMAMNIALPAGWKVDAGYDRDDRGWKGIIKMESIPAVQLQEIITRYPLFQGQTLTTGMINATIRVTGDADNIDTFHVEGTAAGLGVDGSNILEGVGLKVAMRGQSKGNGWHVDNDVAFLRGAMYLMPGIQVLDDRPGFYVEIQDQPVLLHAGIHWIPGDVIEITDLVFDHPGKLKLDLNAVMELADKTVVNRLDIAVRIPDLTVAYPIYLQPLLLQTNFSDLEITGTVDLDLRYATGNLMHMNLAMGNVYIDDRHDRYSVSGIGGNIILTEQATPLESGLRWEGMSLYRLDFGPGDIRLESSARNVLVRDWQDVDILDGRLQINNLSLKNVGSSDFEMILDGMLTPISMQAFTHAMDWPLFTGKLSSVISGLKYSHNSIVIDGDIRVNVFDGEVILRGLQVWDIFSNYSTLTTDVKVHNLDLEQLTDTFAFGKIEGSLSGRMDRLKLEDWQPAYFEAEFASPEDDDRPHRISQKALENLNQIGGGLSGTLSNGFLRFFPVYSYGRIGLSCRLFNGICELGGVEETEEGFYLLTRGGVFPPWVDVKGTGHSIKWDDLIGGLKQISEGEFSLQ